MAQLMLIYINIYIYIIYILIFFTISAMATGELCEMQIGKKLVKVQKIVMTKAEVEAMAKKGLVEMKVIKMSGP